MVTFIKLRNNHFFSLNVLGFLRFYLIYPFASPDSSILGSLSLMNCDYSCSEASVHLNVWRYQSFCGTLCYPLQCSCKFYPAHHSGVWTCTLISFLEFRCSFPLIPKASPLNFRVVFQNYRFQESQRHEQSGKETHFLDSMGINLQLRIDSSCFWTYRKYQQFLWRYLEPF